MASLPHTAPNHIMTLNFQLSTPRVRPESRQLGPRADIRRAMRHLMAGSAPQ